MDISAKLIPGVASCVVKLILDFGQNKWAVGAGFILSGANGPCIATTFHNLSGGLSPLARFKDREVPNPLRIELFYEGLHVASFSPYGKDRSLFRVHPDMEEAGWCDVAVLDVADLGNKRKEEGENSPFWTHPGIDAPSAPLHSADHAFVTDMYLAAGRDALVFGYPGGRDFHEMPIGVGCKIAALTGAREPGLLLSGHTSAGCSGAPAIARDFGGYQTLEPAGLVRKHCEIPLVDQWLGLYSGRLENVGAGYHDGNTQIGVVWSARTVSEVATTGIYEVL